MKVLLGFVGILCLAFLVGCKSSATLASWEAEHNTLAKEHIEHCVKAKKFGDGTVLSDADVESRQFNYNQADKAINALKGTAK